MQKFGDEVFFVFQPSHRRGCSNLSFLKRSSPGIRVSIQGIKSLCEDWVIFPRLGTGDTDRWWTNLCLCATCQCPWCPITEKQRDPSQSDLTPWILTLPGIKICPTIWTIGSKSMSWNYHFATGTLCIFCHFEYNHNFLWVGWFWK